jgi:hypothetical protein
MVGGNSFALTETGRDEIKGAIIAAREDTNAGR